VRHGRQAMTDEIRTKCGAGEAAGFGRFCGYLTDLYQLELPNFIDRNFDSVFTLVKPPWPLVKLVRMGGLRRLANVVGSYFSDPRLQRIFSFQSMYAGLSPYEALALYCVITYMDTVEGVYFPEGGIHAVPRGLAAAATKAGAEFRYGATDGRRACGWRAASSWPPTPSSSTPTCRSHTASSFPARRRPGWPAGATTHRRVRCGSPVCGDRSHPRPPTTTSTSAPRGRGPSTPS